MKGTMNNTREVQPDRFWRVCGILIAIYAICYIYQLSNFDPSIDEENLAFNHPNWLELGRWALQAITDAFWPIPTTPFGPYLLFGIFGSIAYYYTVLTFETERFQPIYFILYPLFIAHPVWFNQMEFSANIIGDGIALLLCCWSVSLSKDILLKSPDSWWRWRLLRRHLIILLLGAVAAGVYQSFILVYAVLGVALSLWLYCRSEPRHLSNHIYRMIYVLFMSAAAIALSMGIGAMILLIMGMQLSQHATYFVQIDKLLNDPTSVLGATLSNAWEIYYLNWKDFWPAGLVLVASPIIGAGALLLGCGPWSSAGIINRLITLTSLAIIAALPFSFNLVMGGELPVRTFVAVPLVQWIFLFLPLVLSRSVVIKRGILVIGLIVIVQIVYIQSVVQARAWAVHRQDAFLAGSIYDRIVQTYGHVVDNSPIKVMFFGWRKPESPYPIVPSATSGASFFEWDSGNPHRIVLYMRLIGFTNLRVQPLSRQGCEKVMVEFSKMPAWPNVGSVKRVDDVVLVKLSEDWPGLGSFCPSR
jgi:hypothetical protein